MAQIRVNDLTFAYEGSFDNIFEHATFSIDTNWKLGFIGRNGIIFIAGTEKEKPPSCACFRKMGTTPTPEPSTLRLYSTTSPTPFPQKTVLSPPLHLPKP